MGKRKHIKDNDDHIRKKIRKLQKKLRKRRSPSKSDDSLSSRDTLPDSRYGEFEADNNPETIDIDLSDVENDVRSVITTAEVHLTESDETANIDSAPKVVSQVTSDQNLCDQNHMTTPISTDFLNVLGDSKVKEVPLGPKVPEEVSKRWGRILTDGLNKDHKKDLLTTILIPENFQLLKAPILNQEISSVMTDSSRNRDKRLERSQNHLGVGIAGLTNLMSSLMEGKDIERLEIVKKLSEVGQIMLDLHYENTLNRRMLIIPTLDKKFLTMSKDVKRDAYLFGENLGDKIKAAKTAEKSGLQIRNTTNIGPSPSGIRKYNNTQQGNWRGPPRQQGQRVVRPGGNKQRAPNQPQKRTTTVPTTSSDRYHNIPASRPAYRPTTRK